jgi:hypothetical protein
MRTTLIKIVRGALLLLGLALFVTSCSGPVAKFSTDRKSYLGGDTVHMKNESTGAELFEWSLNDRPIGVAQELSFILDTKAKGPQVFKLKASVEGGPSSTATQTVMATTPLGTVTAWSTFPGVEIIHVTGENEQSVGVTATGYTADPGCGSEGCITMALSPGTYTIDGTSSITRSRRIIELQDNACVSVKMH